MSPESYRAGFIAVVGKPNVGKSTLMNAILQQKIAAVSPRPQTTRRQQLGILTLDSAQIIFMDTPGFHKPRHKLGEKMVASALKSIEDADAILLILDASQPLGEEDISLIQTLRNVKYPKPLVIALNKIDLADAQNTRGIYDVLHAELPSATVIEISSTRGDNLPLLLQHLIEVLPPSEPLYPEDQLTDLYEREIASDLIREAALLILKDEVPHGIAVRIDQYTEKDDDLAVIDATIIVERESHKAIVIGSGGSMIKKIGIHARQEIEAMSGKKVYLNLNVKVRKNWRKDENFLKWLGY